MHMKHIGSLQGGNELAATISQACGFPFGNPFACVTSRCEYGWTQVLEAG